MSEACCAGNGLAWSSHRRRLPEGPPRPSTMSAQARQPQARMTSVVRMHSVVGQSGCVGARERTSPSRWPRRLAPSSIKAPVARNRTNRFALLQPRGKQRPGSLEAWSRGNGVRKMGSTSFSRHRSAASDSRYSSSAFAIVAGTVAGVNFVETPSLEARRSWVARPPANCPDGRTSLWTQCRQPRS